MKKLLILLIIGATFSIAAGCASETARLGHQSQLATPVILTEDSPKTQEFRRGQVFTVRLPQNTASTGYRWHIPRDHLRLVRKLSERPISPERSMVGMPGLYEWRFETVYPGRQPMTFELRAPGRSGQVERSITFDVTTLE